MSGPVPTHDVSPKEVEGLMRAEPEEMAMDHKTEAQLLTAMASATSQAEQERLAAELSALREGRAVQARAHDEAMWAEATLEEAPVTPHRAPYSRSTMDTDWLGSYEAAKVDTGEAESKMRAEASTWYSHLHPGVKEHPDEVLIQAAGLSEVLASQYGAASARAEVAFLEQVRHHAETEGMPIPDPASIRPEPYEHGQYDGSTETSASDTPSLAEGEEPADDAPPSQGTNQSQNLDASTWPSQDDATWNNGDEPPGKKTSARIDTLREIVDRHQHQEIDGMIVDGTTANLLVQIYDGLSEENRSKFESLPLERLVEIGWKVVSARRTFSARRRTAAQFSSFEELEKHVKGLMAQHSDLVDSAEAAYGRQDQGWFDAQDTATLKTLWEIAASGFFASWDDEVYEALSAKGFDFDNAFTASRKTASISLTQVGVEGPGVGVGTDPSGNRVRFSITPKEEADLKAVLYSDLAINFAGVDIEESDLIKEGSRKTAAIEWRSLDPGNPMDAMMMAPGYDGQYQAIVEGNVLVLVGTSPDGGAFYSMSGARSGYIGGFDSVAEAKAAVEEAFGPHTASRKTALAGCACARNSDGTVTTMLCPVHASEDPCATMAAVTGRRRKGSIVRGVCTNCGWGSSRTASRKTAGWTYLQSGEPVIDGPVKGYYDQRPIDADGNFLAGVATCGSCGRSWDAEAYPTPAGLCPFCNGDERAAAPYEVIATASRKTAGEYKGGSPKEGDTATCHKDGGKIQFFAGEWMHLKGTGDSHNDVYPASKAKTAANVQDEPWFEQHYGERGACIKCGADVEFVGVEPNDFERQYGGYGPHNGWWDRGGNYECPRGGYHQSTGAGEDPGFFEAFEGRGYTASRKTSAEGRVCATCGDKIAKDPSSEDPSTWHHDNGESHDHEAKPASKESSLKRAASKIRVGDQDKPALKALATLDSVEDDFEGISGRRVVEHLLTVGQMDDGTRRALRAALEAKAAKQVLHDTRTLPGQTITVTWNGGRTFTVKVDGEDHGTFDVSEVSDEVLVGGETSATLAAKAWVRRNLRTASRKEAAVGDQCWGCGGKGYVRTPMGSDWDDPYGEQFMEVTCSTCGGSGVVNEPTDYPLADDPIFTDRY